jgi:nitrogen fixation NifU-like protein
MSVASIESHDDLRDLYRELILDHSRNPRNFGKLTDATHIADGINPLCGDKLRLYLRIESGQIRDAGFEGIGCAISVASASLLTDIVIGLPQRTALEYFAATVSRLNGGKPAHPDIEALQKIHALDGVREFPARIKCATLPWHALRSAISEQESPATTE